MLRHGGQRGNFLAKIYARRIQQRYRKYRQRKSEAGQVRRKSSLAGYSSEAIIRLIRSRDQLVNQAQVCLENKRVADRSRSNSSGYLLLNDDQRKWDKPRRSLAPSQFLDDPNEKKIIIHRSDSVSTSVKLYERHKFLAEELFKMKQARQQNQPVTLLSSLLFHSHLSPSGRHPSTPVQDSHRKRLQPSRPSARRNREISGKSGQSVRGRAGWDPKTNERE